MVAGIMVEEVASITAGRIIAAVTADIMLAGTALAIAAVTTSTGEQGTITAVIAAAR